MKILPFLKNFLSILKRIIITHKTSLIILLIGVFFPLQIFGDLAEDVWENEGGFPWDVPILLAIHSTASPQLDTLAVNLTKLGVFWGVFSIAIAVGIYLLLKKKWRKLSYFLIVSVGSMIINRTVKILLHRVRPNLWVSPAPEFDYGFPSGHAMASMTLFVLLLILTWGSRAFWLIMILGGIFVLAIGWTRLYLGVHYPSDILAGWAASIAWAVGVSFLIKPNYEKRIT